MRHLGLCAGVAAVLTAVGCATGSRFVGPDYHLAEIHRTAVVQVEGSVKTSTARNQIADYFAMELVGKGYRPIERLQIDALLREQEFQASDLSSADGIARAGEILNVDALVIINIDQYGEESVLTAKLIDVEDGSLLWVGEGSGTSGRTLATIFGAAAGAGLGVALGGDTAGSIVGGVAGGVLGGVAGRALTPHEVKHVRNIIRKACKSLPPNPGGPPPVP